MTVIEDHGLPLIWFGGDAMTEPLTDEAFIERMTETASRKVMVSPEVMEQWTRWRTPDGYLVTCEWGEPDATGFWNPVFTVHNDDRRIEDSPPGEPYLSTQTLEGTTL